MRRIRLVLLVIVVVGMAPLARADAAEQPSIVFPVVGPVSYQDTFGAPRGSTRTHEGQDLMADKMQPLVAVADGTVTFVTIPEPSYGYMLTITDDAGWSYNYIHINNDTPGTDDGAAQLSDVFGPGIEEGARVAAGQLVAYVGDSGNAEHVAPQLHFEIEDSSGVPVNPMAALDAATRLDTPIDGVDAGTTYAPIFPRIAGSDRVATAIEIARHGWPDGAAPMVVLADGDEWAEALPASALAASKGSPLLLTRGPELEDDVATELGRLGAQSVITIGSVDIAAALAERGLSARHIGTAGDPLVTAAAIAAEIGGANGALLVSVESAVDAISAAALAVDPVRPILFSRRATIPQVSVDAWRAMGEPAMVLVGGTAVIGDNIEGFVRGDRLAGADRYATSVATAEAAVALGRSTDEVLIATGTSFADALAVAPLANEHGGIALLVDGSGRGADHASLAWLGELPGAPSIEVVGGSAAVSPRAEHAVDGAVRRV